MNSKQASSDDTATSSNSSNNNNPSNTKDEKENNSSTNANFEEIFKPDTSEWRPLNLFNIAIKNSPRLIGWNDDEFREVLEEHRKRVKEDPTIPNLEETGFGFTEILTKNLKDILYKQVNDDLKSDLKKLEETAVSATSLEDDKEKKFDVREMKVYKNILSSVKYQRDLYIMGEEYAETRRIERREELEREERMKALLDDNDDDDDIVLDRYLYSEKPSYQKYLGLNPTVNPKSLGSTQLNGIFESFIPSRTMHNALLPTVLWTISPPSKYNPDGGPLRYKLNRSVCALIPLSQNLLDQIMKQNILWVLKDESFRESVKGSSRNFLNATDESANEEVQSSAGRVVTTKTVRIYS